MSTANLNTESSYVVPLLIDGEEVRLSNVQPFPVVSAQNNGKILYHAQSADIAIAKKACDRAQIGFDAWKATTGTARRDIFLRAAEILLERREDFVRVQVEETSMSTFQGNLNVTVAASHVRELAGRITGLSGIVPQCKLDYAFSFREPLGVTLAIPPWNSPVILGMRALATPLGAGCAVVLKASELSPRTYHMMVQVLFDAGVPKSAIQMVMADRKDAPAVTEALISHPAIRKIEFIGSVPIGRVIGTLGGKYLKPVLMELGGKCAVIVLEDADLEDAAKKCILGAFLHHGQLCFSTDRIYIVRSIAEKFIELLKIEAENFKSGGAATKGFAQAGLAKLVDARDKGAQFLLGGADYQDESTATLKPSILAKVTEKMDIFDEESFSPSVATYVVDDEDEAIKLVNASAYGLVGAVHTRDMNRGLRIARRMEVGVSHVNGATAYDESTLPLQAQKMSGWGQNNGSWGLEEFTTLKTITVTMGKGGGW